PSRAPTCRTSDQWLTPLAKLFRPSGAGHQRIDRAEPANDARRALPTVAKKENDPRKKFPGVAIGRTQSDKLLVSSLISLDTLSLAPLSEEGRQAGFAGLGLLALQPRGEVGFGFRRGRSRGRSRFATFRSRGYRGGFAAGNRTARGLGAAAATLVAAVL